MQTFTGICIEHLCIDLQNILRCKIRQSNALPIGKSKIKLLAV